MIPATHRLPSEDLDLTVRTDFRCLLLMVYFLALPGCHVLVRLGEEPAAPQRPAAPSEEDEQEGPEFEPPSPPGARPEVPPPPPQGISYGNTDGPVLPSRAVASQRRRTKEPIGNTGINFQSALAPGEDQYVYRTQLRFLQSHSTPGPAEIDANVLINPHVLAYGKTDRWTLFGMVPLVVRDGTVRPPAPPASPGTFSELEDAGVADMSFFAKYRYRERDEPGQTTRRSVFGGIEVPTYDDDFSSDSWDPFFGTVWTYQSLEWGFDWDLGWKFNTGDGIFRHDELFYDTAYTYVLLRGQTLDDEFWQLQSVLEFNGSYITDGSHLVFVAPGFQLIRQRFIVEGSLQLPVIRDVRNDIEPDFVASIGTRVTW